MAKRHMQRNHDFVLLGVMNDQMLESGSDSGSDIVLAGLFGPLFFFFLFSIFVCRKGFWG